MGDFYSHFKTVVTKPGILKPYSQIILLSHMRANTSLFGHILGSSSEIEGYYELHIGYYSWKSFIRQKLLYFESHTPKPGARFMFDKVLHNEHSVNTRLFNDSDKVIISARHPSTAIPSLIKLYERIDPAHQFATVDGATMYYVERLKGLMKFSEELKGKYYFFKSEQIVAQPDKLLSSLSKWLGLKNTLTKEYKTFNKTGEKKSGDSSEHLKQGQILKKSSVEVMEIPDEVTDLYSRAIEIFIENSDWSFTF